MRLYLLRHAKAKPDAPSGRDMDRPLSATGHGQTRVIRRLLTESVLPAPATVISSPALRATTTAQLVMECLGDAPIEQDARIWNASIGDLLDVLDDHVGSPQPLMLVGHNPGFELLARWLTATVPVPGVKTCTLVDLQLSRAPAPGSARLVGIHHATTG